MVGAHNASPSSRSCIVLSHAQTAVAMAMSHDYHVTAKSWGALFGMNNLVMEVQEVFASGPRFSVAVSNGNVMVLPLSQGQSRETQLQQISTHVLNEQVQSFSMWCNFPT